MKSKFKITATKITKLLYQNHYYIKIIKKLLPENYYTSKLLQNYPLEH